MHISDNTLQSRLEDACAIIAGSDGSEKVEGWCRVLKDINYNRDKTPYSYTGSGSHPNLRLFNGKSPDSYIIYTMRLIHLEIFNLMGCKYTIRGGTNYLPEIKEADYPVVVEVSVRPNRIWRDVKIDYIGIRPNTIMIKEDGNYDVHLYKNIVESVVLPVDFKSEFFSY